MAPPAPPPGGCPAPPPEAAAPPEVELPAPPAAEAPPPAPSEVPVRDGADDVTLGGVDWVPAGDGGDDVMLGGVDWIGLRGSAVAPGSATLPGPDGAPLPAVAVEGVLSSWFGAPGDSEQLAAAKIEQVTRTVGFIPKDINGGRPLRPRNRANKCSGGWTDPESHPGTVEIPMVRVCRP